MAVPAVELRDVSKSFDGDRPALSRISLAVETGETVVLLGSSGSGKTTFCAKLARQLKGKGGGVIMAAGDVYRPAAQKQIARQGAMLAQATYEMGDAVKEGDDATVPVDFEMTRGEQKMNVVMEFKLKRFDGKWKCDVGEIIETEGIDMLFFGPADMRIQLGAPINQPIIENPEILKAMEAIAKAAKMGVCKVNIDTDLRMALTAKIRQVYAETPAEFDPRKYLGPGREAIKQMVKHKLQILGCSGKAAECS